MATYTTASATDATYTDSTSFVHDFISDADCQRTVAGVVVGFIVHIGVSALALSLLSMFLWGWLAILLAFIAGTATGFVAGSYVSAFGYDKAKASSSVAFGKLRALFKR